MGTVSHVGLSKIDTRQFARGAQFAAFCDYALKSGFGITDVQRTSPLAGAHLAVSTSLAGAHSGLSFTEVSDPIVLTATAPSDTPMIILKVSGSRVTSINDGRTAWHSPNAPTLLAVSRTLVQTVDDRSWHATIRVRRRDIGLSEAELRRALDGDVSWAPWHGDLLLNSAKSIGLLSSLRGGGADPTGVDRYIAGILEMIVRSALRSPAVPTARFDHGPHVRALQFIRDNLLDSALDSAWVAAHQG
jgi:hypothetical protein